MRTIYLYNFYPHDPLPPLEELVATGDGINISYEALTEEVVSACHAHNKLVCVWIDATVTKEGTDVYRNLIDLGVDSFCSDFPLEIMKLRDQLMVEAIDLLSVKTGITGEARERGVSFGLFEEDDFAEVESNMTQLQIS